MKHKRCLLCLEPLDDTSVEYHEACSKSFFGSVQPPTLDYTMDQMEALATTVFPGCCLRFLVMLIMMMMNQLCRLFLLFYSS